MKRLLISLIPTIVILSIFVGACGKDEGAEGDIEKFYPTPAYGAEWVYDVSWPDGAERVYDISGLGGYSSDSENSTFGLLNIISNYATTQQDQIQVTLIINGTAEHQTAGTVDVQEYSADGSPFGILQYIFVDQNEARWYNYLDDDNHWLLLKCPLTTGNTWNFDYYDVFHYRATIIGEEDVTVPAGTFKNCIKIEYWMRVEGSDEYFLMDEMWFAAKVGIVRWYVPRYDEERQLVSYNIPTY